MKKATFLKVPTYQSPICQKFLIWIPTLFVKLYNPQLEAYYTIQILIIQSHLSKTEKKNTLQIILNYNSLAFKYTPVSLFTFTRLFVENFKMNQDDLIDFEGFSESGKGSDTRGLWISKRPYTDPISLLCLRALLVGMYYSRHLWIIIMRFDGNFFDIPHMGMQGGQSAQTPDHTNTWEKILSFFLLPLND